MAVFWALPPHIRPFENIPWETLDQFMANSEVSLYDDYLHAKRNIVGLEELRRIRGTGEKMLELSGDDFKRFLEGGYFKPLDRPPLVSVALFTTAEKADEHGNPTRRRLVNWPVDINRQGAAPRVTKLASRSDLLQGCRYPGATRYDIVSMYMHFPLTKESEPYYGFTWNGEWYTLGAIPTGGTHCPALAQSVSLALVVEAMRRLRRELGGPVDIHTDVYIDNFRFAGEKWLVAMAEHHFENICNELGFRWTKEEYAVAYTFLGVCVDHVSMETKAAPKSLAKLAAAAQQALAPNATVRDGFKLLGSLMWISWATEVHIADYYFALKFFRRRAASNNLEEPLSIWPSVMKELTRWIANAAANLPRKIPQKDAEPQEYVYVFSDACLDGFGGVCISQQGLHVMSGAWPRQNRHPHINQLEACALLLALKQLKHRIGTALKDQRLKIFVDNTTLFNILRRSYSPTFWGNEVAKEVASLLHDAKSWTISWIRSEEMLADSASRARPSMALECWTPLEHEEWSAFLAAIATVALPTEDTMSCEPAEPCTPMSVRNFRELHHYNPETESWSGDCLEW